MPDQEKNDISLGQLFFEKLKKYSPNILQYIADTDETDTYGEVLTRSMRIALKLKEMGITKDDIVSSCTNNHKNTIIPFIATLFLGAKSANFDPNVSHLDTIHLLKLIQPKVIFVTEQSLPFMEDCLVKSNVNSKLIVFGNSEKYINFEDCLEYRKEEENFQPVRIENTKETAIILFSSGTTGFPKGICLSHYCLLSGNNRGRKVFPDFYEEKKKDVYLLFTTLYWISAVACLISCVSRGDSRVVCANFDPKETWKILEKYKVTFTLLAPYHAVDFLDNPVDADTRSLEVFTTGSCLVTKDLMEGLIKVLPHTKVVQIYAQTEVGGLTSFFDINKPDEYKMQLKKPRSCGRILPGISWKVVDPSTEEVLGPNQIGELRIKSDSFMNGYYKMDSSSAYDSDGYLKTGDTVYYDEEDCFYVADRIKEIFKYRGWHILPAILEEVLLSHPAVKDAVVVGIPHKTDGEHPMGLVVIHNKYKDVKLEEIEKFVEERVSDNQRLRAGVKIVDKLLRTVTGKVKRNVMKQMVLDGKI